MNATLSGMVYFDNAATMAPLPEVITKLNELNSSLYGNSSSAHQAGRDAQEIFERAQNTLAQYFKVPSSHVIFTSGGTESNNLAIWGALGGLVPTFQWLKSGATGKLLTSTVEHDATKKVFECFQAMGAQVGWIGVDQQGLLNLAQLETELENRTRLVSFHHAQNEVGVLQDVAKVGQLIREKQPDALFHVDAIQSFLKVPIDLESMHIDLLSISGHKIGGPKGVGAIILGKRFQNRSPKLGSLIQGSSQQLGIRPGTVPVPSIAAMATAIELGIQNFQENRKNLLSLRQHLIENLPAKTILNGPLPAQENSPNRVPQTVCFSVPGLPSSMLVEALSSRGYCISAGSACHASSPKPNETLSKMGVPRDVALSAIRVSFNSKNTRQEVDGFLNALQDTIRQFT